MNNTFAFQIFKNVDKRTSISFRSIYSYVKIGKNDTNSKLFYFIKCTRKVKFYTNKFRFFSYICAQDVIQSQIISTAVGYNSLGYFKYTENPNSKMFKHRKFEFFRNYIKNQKNKQYLFNLPVYASSFDLNGTNEQRTKIAAAVHNDFRMTYAIKRKSTSKYFFE